MSNPPSDTELEKELEQIFSGPNAAFVSQLERRLVLQQAAARQQPVRQRNLPIFHLRGWMAAAALAGIVFVVIASVGPQKALAAVQKLIGYMPGIGFVENPQQPMRVLAEPVKMEREGVTLTVEKVLASAQDTQVRIRVDGLPQDKSLFERGWGESSQPLLREASPNSGTTGERTLTTNATVSGAGEFIWAEYTFPPLSADAERVSLLLNRLPGLKAGVAPENWIIDIPLHEVQPGDGLVTAIQEPRTSQPAGGAQLVLESIAATQKQTALKLRLTSDDPNRKADWEWWRGLSLVDDQGQELALTYEQPLRGLSDGSTVLLAPPLNPSRRYALRLEQSGFEYRFNSSQPIPRIRLSAPANVQVGQTWAVDQTLEAGGYPLHVTQASLIAGAVEGFGLRLTIDPQPGLVGVGLNCKDFDVCSSSGFDLAQPGQPLTTDVYLNQPLKRSIDLQAQVLLETVRGPWEINFQVDGSQ
jgi:hypothetical protein